MTRGTLAIAALSIALVGCGDGFGRDVGVERESAEPARAIDPPAAEGAFAPDLWADDEGLLLTWIEPRGPEREDGHRLRLSARTDAEWSAPVTIAEGTDLFANWADVPAAARAADGTLHAHWLAKTASDTYAYSILLARSTDGGATWEPVGKLNDDETHTEHGFVSWVREGPGLRAFWLDGRAMADGGPMSVRTAVVDVGGVGEVEMLDDRVCECCSTDAAVAASGPYVVYRDRSETEVRDTSLVARTASGWSPPRSVHVDGWSIEGCPVNGPETDADGELAVTAWFTAANGRARVRAAFSTDGGATFGEPATVDADGPLGRVDTVLDGEGGALVSWLAAEGERAAVTLARLSADGSMGGSMVVAETSAARASGFPRLVRRHGSAYVAWVDLDSERPSRIRFAELPLSAIGR